MRHPIISVVSLALLALSATSCLIDNDMSYPIVYADVTSFEVEGQTSSAIDTRARTVSIVLGETAYMDRLTVLSSSITEGAVCEDFPAVGSTIDLTASKSYVLTLYRRFPWTISATQPIERYVRCANQAADPIIRTDVREVLAYVPESQDLRAVTINDMKLEREGSVIYQVGRASDGTETRSRCSFPMVVDAIPTLVFDVESRGETFRWHVSIVQKTVTVEMTSLIPWCYHLDVAGTFNGTGTPYFQYRRSGTESWTDITDVTVDGVSVSASINGLDSGTTYQVRICSGENVSEVSEVSTGTPDQIDNSDFEDWCYQGRVCYPVSEAGFASKIWDSANEGVASFLSTNPTVPETEFTATPSSMSAAKLTNTYAVIKYAAGNILTGDFIGLQGLGARLSWGTPFTARPRAIKGYYSYTPGRLDYIDNERVDSDRLDKCQIMVILTDWDSPFEVNTTAGQFVDQENDEHIIAYLRFETDEDSTGEYVPFEMELDYRRPDGIPKYAVVVACASSLGDEFTGSTSSVMYVDEFEFVYD